MMKTDAKLSPCRKYRYALWRVWNPRLPKVCVIGLNPSVADEKNDDPTIIREIDFAKQWGAGGLRKANIFGFRATKPIDMKRAADPIGPENDEWIRTLSVVTVGENMPVVAAWGTNGSFKGRAREVMEMLSALGVTLQCLGKTNEGHPKHPLYLPKTTKLELWP